MHALGLEQFGAWSVLLGGSFAFGTLELGMSNAVMRWATLAMMPESRDRGLHGLDAVMTNSLACTTMVFLLAGTVVYFIADPLAAWLNLPRTPLLSPGQCILLMYATVAVLALLRCTIAPMLAARRIVAHSSFILLQSVVGAVATWSVAWTTHRLDLVLIANTIAVVSIQSLAAIWARRRMAWRVSRRSFHPGLALDMLRYGAALQFSDLSTFVIYQFDKLVISGVVAPLEVSHYEIASRSAQALGNMSSAPFIAFAPSLTERHGRNEEPTGALLRMLRITVLGGGLFLLLPTALAPIALFAWVGEVGYHASGTFVLLSLSVMSTLLVMPMSMLAQAMGRASMEFSRSCMAMVVNVPSSWMLIHAYGKEGAALGTLIACLLANVCFALWLHRRIGLSWRRTASELRPLAVPLLVVAIALAFACRGIQPYVISSRALMAPATLLLYAAALACVFTWLWRSGAIREEERRYLKLLKERWLAPLQRALT
jgi:O-antigen/teichoic acid export membrane protein